MLGKPVALPLSVSCPCMEQRLLPLCKPGHFPQIFSVALRAPQVKEPRTFLLYVYVTEGERAGAGPAVPPLLKSDLFCHLPGNIDLKLEEKFHLIFSHIPPPPPAIPSPARCSLLAAVHRFQLDVARIRSILLGVPKGYWS